MVTLVGYGLLFHSPLPWLAGEVLVSNTPASTADAIMVFAVEGEPYFVNTSYQKRAIDALALYQAGLAPRIFITSSKDTSVSEAEVIRALLVGQGVPPQAVTVLNETTRNTAASVQLAIATLRIHNLRKALLTSSPYTSLRIQLTWQHLAPDLMLIAPAAIDNPSRHVHWQTNERTVRAIIYEYLAIAYYWIKGWL